MPSFFYIINGAKEREFGISELRKQVPEAVTAL